MPMHSISISTKVVKHHTCLTMMWESTRMGQQPQLPHNALVCLSRGDQKSRLLLVLLSNAWSTRAAVMW